MLDLTQYESLGAALRDALDRWPDEVCLIEADRDRERSRLTYRQFREAAEPLAAALEDSGFAAGARAAIIMTNQPKWLISAYAVFFAGGVVVPLDYKLSAAEHLQLLAHSKAEVLFVEYPLWRAITQAAEFREHKLRTVWSPRRRRTLISRAGCGGRSFARPTRPNSGLAPAKTRPASSIPPAPEAARKDAC